MNQVEELITCIFLLESSIMSDLIVSFQFHDNYNFEFSVEFLSTWVGAELIDLRICFARSFEQGVFHLAFRQ